MNDSRRVDIDVLRAISVISVIIFHFDKNFFPLGYLGVDIFFVISGYLISKIIIHECEDNKFTFKNFYLRRARRILPALMVVLIVTLLFAFFILLTADLKIFAESLLTSLGFFPNIYFWITGGYFGTNDELKPLLHLWSLGVEEQFYLFFPIVLFFVLKKITKLSNKILFMIAISSISFAINIYFINKGHLDSIFFLFPARIWQFGLGAIVAVFPVLRNDNKFYNSLIIYIAFVLVFFNFYKIIPYIPHASLTCLGVSIILYKGINKNSFLFKLINIKILIFTGLISYSLYLWHWPIISFLKYIKITNLDFLHISIGIFLTITFSIFTWKYVEKPFLKKNPNEIFKFVGLGYFFLIMVSGIILLSKNFPSRYEKQSNYLAEAVGTTYHCSVLDYRKFGDSYACIINNKVRSNPEVVLLGNSHAHMYGWALKEYLTLKKKKGLTIPLNTCLPLIDKNISVKCLKKSKKYFQSIINDKQIKIVIIGLTWNSNVLVDEKLIKSSNFAERDESLIYLIDKLKENNKKVFLIGPIETPNFELASIASRELAFQNSTKKELFSSRKSFENKYKKTINFFKNKIGNSFLEPHHILCDEKNCYFADSKGSNFSDSNHLSYYGSKKMKKIFINILN